MKGCRDSIGTKAERYCHDGVGYKAGRIFRYYHDKVGTKAEKRSREDTAAMGWVLTYNT